MNVFEKCVLHSLKIIISLLMEIVHYEYYGCGTKPLKEIEKAENAIKYIDGITIGVNETIRAIARETGRGYCECEDALIRFNHNCKDAVEYLRKN